MGFHAKGALEFQPVCVRPTRLTQVPDSGQPPPPARADSRPEPRVLHPALCQPGGGCFAGAILLPRRAAEDPGRQILPGIGFNSAEPKSRFSVRDVGLTQPLTPPNATNAIVTYESNQS